MKKIIVKGKPELRKHECQCVNCECQFVFTEDEIYKSKPKGICGSVNCIKCPWCFEEIKLPAFDKGIDYVPQTQDSDVNTGEKISAGSYEAMVDEIG